VTLVPVFSLVFRQALKLGEKEPKIYFVSAERAPDLSLEQVQETEVIYVLMPHAVRLPAVQRRPAPFTVPWDQVREQVATNLAAFGYAVGFTVTLALFIVGAFVLKSVFFGVNETHSSAYKIGVSAPRESVTRV
jgi:hypothetical protein